MMTVLSIPIKNCIRSTLSFGTETFDRRFDQRCGVSICSILSILRGKMTTHSRPELRTKLAFLAGGAAMGAMMRAHAWEPSPLGSPEDWPQSLKTLVSLMLGSAQPMFIIWGADR